MAMPRLVLDIWHGNRGIDLAAWKSKHDLWAVIVKCGGSDDPSIGYYEETTFVQQCEQARSLGLHVGAYYYSDATTPDRALRDAKHCVEKCMRGQALDMPLYLDIEEASQLALSMQALTNVVTTFCEYVRGAGYTAGIYSGYDGFHNMFESKIADYALWVAAWRHAWPTWAKDYGMWQQGSMRLSDGDIQYADVSGYVDCNWCQIGYPAIINGGGEVATYDPASEAAEIHAFMCTDPRFGYSQDPRWGGDYNGGEVAVFTSSTGHTYRIPCGSYDCSSSTTLAWRLALSCSEHAGCLGDNPYERTASMRETFCGTGLFRASLSNARRGDLYLNEGVHVAMCQDGGGDGVFGYDCLSEFNRNEYHGAVGGKAGDQDGGESVIRAYYNDDWNTVLHYIGGPLRDTSKGAGDNDDEVTEMRPIFVRFDGTQTEHLFNPWAGTLRAIANNDEKKAVVDLYAKAGVTIDTKVIDFGTMDAPWGARVNDALSRGANFEGFERFEKHPSTRMVVRSEIEKAMRETPIAKLVREES